MQLPLETDAQSRHFPFRLEMCGIFALFNYTQGAAKGRSKALGLSKRLRHRGPDWSGCKVLCDGKHFIAHERLAIVGVESGAQPLTNEEETVVLSVNGEIYNYRELKTTLSRPHDFKTESDCEVIMYLYEEQDVTFVDSLDGIFAFVLFDKRTNRIVAARDPIGVTTMYAGFNTVDKSLWFASELKSLAEDCDIIVNFPPGHLFNMVLSDGCFDNFQFEDHLSRYYKPTWLDESIVPSLKQFPQANLKAIRYSLEAAVHKRLMADVPFGVLLSGGLDSSLVAAIAARAIEQYSQYEGFLRMGDSGHAGVVGSHKRPDLLRDGDEPYDENLSFIKALQWFPKLHSFSIGVTKDSPDLKAAREVAQFLKTIHHEYTFTVQEGIDALSDVVYHLETYDVTTIRASTPMFLLSRRIKSMGVKMVLSGEGSDELLGGYLYFYDAPNPRDFHVECVKRVKNLHLSDCLRANKSTMAWGLEARVPFLDKKFVQVVLETIPPELKQCQRHIKGESEANRRRTMEKYVLRAAFDTPDHPFLPDSILWRQKEQFSDGVGYSWIDELKRYTDAQVSDEQFSQASTRFPHDTPTTKEAFFYRVLFEEHFPQKACLGTVMRWIPRRDWGCAEDPSGRAQKAHTEYLAEEVKE